ncbi:hypothetical protein EYR40_005063 [Pleurotus pulmonarius]|nr:hypothetical protein EYR36_006559 [Pleurotus pulmonarius]KAF4601258.1 hypothetical protein EYR38_005910 [Pleurotus pulmonarius]KAF4601863.1 hypothetical protein EYR40_005063 [Pleurotus pulmonarius]
MSNSIRVAILTVSDTASLDANADKSGPTINEIVSKAGFICTEAVIVPDSIPRIQNQVKRWCDQGNIDWIITTGGTGFGVRDLTPEAISPLLERHASGLVHLLMATSLQHTPMAALSRPVAGTAKNTLIVTLPGSVRAVKENMDALVANGVVKHALELIQGGTGQNVHKNLPSVAVDSTQLSSAQLHHHHDHHHEAPRPRTILSHDPQDAVSTRHRVSPYPLISLEQALDLISQEVRALPVQRCRVSPGLKGHILAENVYAPQDVPIRETTNVDGYALRSSDPPGFYKVCTPASHRLNDTVPSGVIYRINTGAPLPNGTDAVIMVEDTALVSTDASGEEAEVQTLAQVAPGENLRSPGSDVRKGDLVLEKGQRLLASGGEIGTLAFVGRKEVEVYQKPVIALLSTGDEITDIQSSESISSSDSWKGIWDTNRPSLQAALEGLGYSVIDLGIVTDSLGDHISAIRKGLDSADIVLTTGGTSMGASDLLKPVIERHFEGTVHFGRITIKPGKPTTFATIPTVSGRHKPIFALPGNPASALVTFNVFVVPALRKLGGWPSDLCNLPRVKVKLQDSMKLDTRTEFHRVVVRSSNEGLLATSTGGQRSSRVASLSGANGLVILPQRKDGNQTVLDQGSLVDAIMIGELL